MRSAPRIWQCRRPPRRCGRRCRRPTADASGIEGDTMYAFTYHRPDDACGRRQACWPSRRKPSSSPAATRLIPTMKLRLAGPKHLVDLSKIEGLTGIEMTGRSLTIGAMTPHAEVATSPVVQENIPALADARRQDRRSGRPPPRHDRRLDRQQRSQRRLSGRLPRPRRHHHHQQAPHHGRRILQGPVRDRARARRDHHQGAVSRRSTRRPT